MVVGEHEPGAAEVRGIGDDGPQRKRRAHLIAVMAGDVQAARIVVDMRDPQALARGSESAKQPAKKVRAAARPSSVSGGSAR